MVSWIDVTENRHVGRRSHLRPKDTLAEVTFPPHNTAEYIEHAQLLAMDYPNMLTADAVRNHMIDISITKLYLNFKHIESYSFNKRTITSVYMKQFFFFKHTADSDMIQFIFSEHSFKRVSLTMFYL